MPATPFLESLWKANFAALAPYWPGVFNELGATAVVLPLVGPDGSTGGIASASASNFRTVRSSASGDALAFTWQGTDGGPSNWTNGNDYTNPNRWQGIVPIVNFDGVNDEADTPDYSYWSRPAGAFSLGAWVRMTDATSSTILSKFNSGSDRREWVFHLTSGDDLQLILYDESVSGNPTIDTVTDTAISENAWVFLVGTHDGSANATGINLYVNGEAAASTDTDDSNFVATEDLDHPVELGFSNGTNFFDGDMAGGPLGPFFTTVALTGPQVKNLYFLGRPALGLV
jgi:hypothetical protein